MDEYQKEAMKVLYPFRNRGKQLEYSVLALCGEAGELANVLKHIVYYKDTSYTEADMVDELSDVLWYVACVADSLSIKLSELATYSLNKITAKSISKESRNNRERMKKDFKGGIK